MSYSFSSFYRLRVIYAFGNPLCYESAKVILRTLLHLFVSTVLEWVSRTAWECGDDSEKQVELWLPRKLPNILAEA